MSSERDFREATYSDHAGLREIGPPDPDLVDGHIPEHRVDEPSSAGDEADFERLLGFLKESRAFDFTGYKRPSLLRRIRHRMREVSVSTVDEYLDLLQLQPEEFTALFNTILINVTGFFRDPEAWEYLRDEILPDLLVAGDDAPLRVWSAGCSAGQEPYTIAMILHEALGEEFRDRVKIYATDIDEDRHRARRAHDLERIVEQARRATEHTRQQIGADVRGGPQ